jgi:hypothetical protein
MELNLSFLDLIIGKKPKRGQDVKIISYLLNLLINIVSSKLFSCTFFSCIKTFHNLKFNYNINKYIVFPNYLNKISKHAFVSSQLHIRMISKNFFFYLLSKELNTHEIYSKLRQYHYN